VIDRRVITALAFVSAIATGSACGGQDVRPAAAPATASQSECSSQPVEEQLRKRPSVAVILTLREAGPGASRSELQDRVLRDLGTEFQVARRYAAIPALAGEINRTGFGRARIHPDIRCIQLDGAGSGTPALP
jgi:hypothetical protein